MTARDMTGFYAFFSASKSAIFSTLGAISSINCTQNLENKKIHWRKLQKIQWSRDCRFLSLVVVERTLTKAPKVGISKPGVPKLGIPQKLRIKFSPPPPTPEFLTKDFPSATRPRTKILTKENLVGAKIAPTPVSRSFTPLVRRIRFR